MEKSYRNPIGKLSQSLTEIYTSEEKKSYEKSVENNKCLDAFKEESNQYGDCSKNLNIRGFLFYHQQQS